MISLTGFYRFLSIDVWGGLPASWQRMISRIYATLYNSQWSKLIIEPYCKHHYEDPDYLLKFKPASGGSVYQSFQDFFSRQLIEPLTVENEAIWPAEGLLCEYGKVEELKLVKVKGEKRHLRSIFGKPGQGIPDSYYFSNVFLHNNNYHRIHSPVDGKVKHIERISGDLVLLRPWVYKHDPSLPALRNERLNFVLEDQEGRNWYLSVVGGPAVGTINLADGIEVGTQIEAGEELSIFLLGSTCCMAGPIPSDHAQLNDRVYVGDPL